MQKRFILCLALFLSALPACQPKSQYQSQAEEVFPPVTITRAALFRMGNLGISPEFFSGQWTAVLFASSSCDSACQHRLALANEGVRAQALLVIVDLANHAQLLQLKKQYPAVEISMGTTAASIDSFVLQFEDEAIPPEGMADYIYLVSPDAELSYRLDAQRMKSGDLTRELQALESN